MPEFLLQNGESSGIFDGTTEFAPQVAFNPSLPFDTEGHTQCRATDAYTIDQLHVFVTGNSLNVSATFVQRIDGVNGNQTITVTATSTGLFGDTTNNDSISDDELINFQISAPLGSGSIGYSTITTILDGNQFPYMCTRGSSGWGPNNTFFLALNGELSADIEGLREIPIRADTTFDGCGGFCTVNGVSDPSVLQLRIDQSDGNQSATIPASTTGRFDDTTNNDIVLADSDVVYEFNVGMGSHNDTFITIVTLYCSGAGLSRILNCGGNGRDQLPGGQTNYTLPEGNLGPSATEANKRGEIRSTQTLDNLRLQCQDFDLDVNSVVSVNINGTASSITVTITGTGDFTDTTNNEAVESGDDLGVVYDGSASSSGNMGFSMQSINSFPPSAEVLAYGFWF